MADRIERDTLGEVRVPEEALYGAQTQRAVENYPVSGLRAHPLLIRSIVLIKKAASRVNRAAGDLDAGVGAAIESACDRLLQDESLRAQFVVDVFQAGAGTSFHMNANEVIASLANLSMGGRAGDSKPVHPNDHVNMAQSTNDVFPTSMRIAILLLLRELGLQLDGLAAAFEERGNSFHDVVKSGRTHLQDAVPVTLGQEFLAWSTSVKRATRLLRAAADEIRELGIGGTAAGTGINTPLHFRHHMAEELSALTGLELTSSPDLREAMQSQLGVVAVSAALRNLALELTRITNDIRLLASGPLTGLAEIELPAVQPGSSIMPGKVNPSMLECMNQLCFHIIGADTAVAYASQAGQLELNVMMPMMAFQVLTSMQYLTNYLPVFVERCIAGIEADRERCAAYANGSPSLATALNPIIGYARAAEIAKESASTGKSVPTLLRERGEIPEDEIARLLSPDFLAGQADR